MTDATKTRVYLDTEFTSLNRSTSQLISLALVIFKGQEFYVELTDTWAESDCSDFVRSIVLPQLDITNHGCTADEARSAVLNWLGQFSRVEIYTDAPQWDWFLLTVLCGKQGIPLHVKLAEVDTEFLEAEACSETPHHALKDARILARMLENSLA